MTISSLVLCKFWPSKDLINSTTAACPLILVPRVGITMDTDSGAIES